MSRFLLRVCKGNTDDETRVELMDVEGATFDERIAHARAQAQAAVEQAIDEAVENDAAAGVCRAHTMREDPQHRFVYTCDGIDIANFQAVLG